MWGLGRVGFTLTCHYPIEEFNAFPRPPSSRLVIEILHQKSEREKEGCVWCAVKLCEIARLSSAHHAACALTTRGERRPGSGASLQLTALWLLFANFIPAVKSLLLTRHTVSNRQPVLLFRKHLNISRILRSSTGFKNRSPVSPVTHTLLPNRVMCLLVLLHTTVVGLN